MSTAGNQPDDTTATRPIVGGPAQAKRTTDSPVGHRELLAREKEEFGGMKFGAGFFGWLAATGTAVLLGALLAAVGVASGMTPSIDPANPAAASTRAMGLTGGIILLAVILIAYFCGGYVAGRMARFNGLKQGIAVWLWAIIAAVVITVLALVAGSQSNVLSTFGLPQIPVSTDTLTAAGIITAVAVALVALIGAILGGLAGMRFHRRVDRAGLGR